MGTFSLSYVWDSILRKFGYIRVGTKQDENKDYAELNKYNFNAIFANSLKNYAISDKKIEVQGTSDRAILLNTAVERLAKDLGKLVSQMLGYGGVLAVPYHYEGNLYFDIVEQNNLEIESMAGDKILDCVVLADTISEKSTHSKYYLFRRYQLENNTLIITNTAKKDTSEIPLADVVEWADIAEEIRIAGVEKMPFAYFKSPKDNRRAKNKKGVPITFGAENIIKEIEECLCQVHDEFGSKQVRLFVDSVMFDSEERLQNHYKKVNIGDGSSQFETFDPAFRDSSYYARLMQLFALLERTIGTSAGILTPLSTNNATATEIKMAMLDTYNLIDDIRTEISLAIDDYIKACEVLANYFSIVAYGDYELKIDWGYNLVESSTETFTQLTQAQAVGAVSKAEIRSYIYPNENKEEAQKAVDEIAKAEPTIASTFSM